MASNLTVTQFATQTGVGRRTVLRWIREGRIHAERTPGGHWRIPSDEVLMRAMTVTEFARAAGVCRRTVLRWIASGKLDAASTPGGYMVAAAEAKRLGVDRLADGAALAGAGAGR